MADFDNEETVNTCSAELNTKTSSSWMLTALLRFKTLIVLLLENNCRFRGRLWELLNMFLFAKTLHVLVGFRIDCFVDTIVSKLKP